LCQKPLASACVSRHYCAALKSRPMETKMIEQSNKRDGFLAQARATLVAALRDEESGPMSDKYELSALPPFVVAALALALVIMILAVILM
jgi:hypothetical protein